MLYFLIFFIDWIALFALYFLDAFDILIWFDMSNALGFLAGVIIVVSVISLIELGILTKIKKHKIGLGYFIGTQVLFAISIGAFVGYVVSNMSFF